MIGMFGNVEKAIELGIKPDIIYTGFRKLERYVKGVVPLIWVPETRDIDEGVVDVHGKHYLFAFNNSGCIAIPKIINRVLETLGKLHQLGYNKVILDAIRLPSPVDELFFLTTCFCNYSLKLYPRLNELKNKIKSILNRASAREILEVLEELAHARALHVENILSIINDRARKYGIELTVAVFPYPLSKYVGQEPKILKKYLKEIHVMLYHRCSGAACLNTELEKLANTMKNLGLGSKEIHEILRITSGLELSSREIKELNKGLPIEYIEKLMEANKEVYKEKFIPIIWLDNNTIPKVKKYLEKYQNLDLFVP